MISAGAIIPTILRYPDGQRSKRTLWTTAQVRATDIRPADIIRLNGVWRDVFEVWHDGTEVSDAFDGDVVKYIKHHFGETSKEGVLATEKLEWTSPMWVLVRFIVQEKCNAGEVEDDVAVLFMQDLIDVQVPLATQQGVPPVTEEST